MRLGANGLRDVPTEELRTLLKFVYRGDLTCPLDIAGLTRVGLQYIADRLGHLRGLDERAVMAVVIAVISERT